MNARALYDACIATRREVPTREGHWHDFLNACVWMVFPQAKLALHTRMHAAIQARLARKQHNRSDEENALATLDESGAVDFETAQGVETVVFGHSIYESWMLGLPVGTLKGIRCHVANGVSRDEALAQCIAQTTQLTHPRHMGMVVL